MNQTIEKRRFAELIRTFNFRTLFNELGWDDTSVRQDIPIDGTEFKLKAVAEKRGFVIFVCEPDGNGKIPVYDIRRKIDTRLSKLYFEHLIIYLDAKHSQQLWQVVIREFAKPILPREETYYTHQEPEVLYQKLSGLFFSLDEEDKIGIVDVHARMADAFNQNAEKVTKKFFERFETEHEHFKGFIEGISQESDIEWYASIMLNRLMFIYFIQKKGFLNNDLNYLRTKLLETQNKKGQNQYYSFYRNFLLVLFHQGLGASNHSQELSDEIGRIPYLNGGLFDVHQIEKTYPDIQIKDQAFEKIFDFFDEWNWHLDTRVCATGKDINPDVLGYVYEKYINQKQMGAYYTKEDITGYISQNTIIPCLFDKAKKECKIAFDGDHTFWKLLQDDPDRYIYDAVKKGVEKPLPPEIETGVDTSQPNLIERRKEWNKPASEEYALPTEIWREVVARRQRYAVVWEKMVAGEVHEINDFITYNLNIRQFALDVIVNCEGPELLRAFWKAIKEISILDPTVGSGAFLFAALNILESLYEACLDRMQAFVDELEQSGEKHRSDKYGDFKKVLAQIEKHPNRRYFIFKSIIVNNLYGVDIMEEAVEICRLRLFLKLVAETDVDYAKPNMGLEPLPDIDFNIKAGNSLVGFATYEETKKSVEGVHQLELGFTDYMKAIDEKAEEANLAFQRFRELQVNGETEPGQIAREKVNLLHRLAELNDELSRYLAVEYGKKPEKKNEYDQWLKSHQPFHWFVEFYGIVHQKGGFDVIIGNPPYVEYSKVINDYTVRGYATESCGNLYALVIERCFSELRNNGLLGMIVQLPIVCTDRMKPLQKEFLDQSNFTWFANFDDRPAKLFDGLQHIRATIFTTQKGERKSGGFYSTTYNRWYSDVRSTLFEQLAFESVSDYLIDGAIPKIGHPHAKFVINRITEFTPLGIHLLSSVKHPVYFHNSPQYWIRAMTIAPYFWNERSGEQLSTQIKLLNVANKLDMATITASLNSSLFYWWFIVLSDCRHLNLREIESFPLGLDRMTERTKSRLEELVTDLMKDYKKHAVRKETEYQTTGKVIYDEFYPRYSKPIIDEIDRVLAKHYGFTEEELDFIINYDIKYRMGKENV